MAQRARASAWEHALGQGVGSQRAVRARTDRLTHASAAWRTRARRGCASAALWRETVEAPRRRWGSQPGRLGVWGRGVDGRTGGRTLARAPRARADRGRAGRRERGPRGLQTPLPSTTAGAPGLRHAVEALGPRALRRRSWLPKRPPRPHPGPPPAGPAGNAWVADRREAPTWEAGQRRLPPLLAPDQAPCPAAGRCREEDARARRHHRTVPARPRPEGRTSPLAERACAAERRRTPVLEGVQLSV